MLKAINVHLPLSKIDYLVHSIAKNLNLNSKQSIISLLNNQGLLRSNFTRFRKISPGGISIC